MTHQLWLYTPRKITLGQHDFLHTVMRFIFEAFGISLPLTVLCWVMGSLPSSEKHFIQGLWSILTLTEYSVGLVSHCYLSVGCSAWVYIL